MLESGKPYSLRSLFHQVRKLRPVPRSEIIGERLAQPGADVYVVSFPKCGRTWLRTIVGMYLVARNGVDQARLTETYDLTRALTDFPTLAFTHDDVAAMRTRGRIGNLHYRKLATRKDLYADSKVALLVRDPRDTLVSYYYHCTRRRTLYSGPISSFIRDESFGAPKLARFLAIWHEKRDVPRDFIVMSYEQMHQDAVDQLTSFFEFCGHHPDRSLLEAAVQSSAFDKMRTMEVDGDVQSSRLKVLGSQDEMALKTRKGVVGGYVEELAPEDIDYIDRTMERFLPEALYRQLIAPAPPAAAT